MDDLWRESDSVGEEWLTVSGELEPGDSDAILPKRRARTWATVLEARRLPCRLLHIDDGWQLLVPPERMAEALEELCLFERENRHWPPPLPPSQPLADNALPALCVLILLATFYNITLLDIDLLGHHPVDWSALGNAYAGKIRNGEWWRTVTALTLHADWLHLFGNLAIGAVFVVRLCRLLGSGLAWSLVLLSGMLGNGLNAYLQAYHHQAVGASTALFGAVGLLASLSLMHYHRALWRRWPLPVAAAAGLLALLGSGGERTDIGAHLLGFVSGMILGAAAGVVLERHGRPGGWLNVILAIAAAGTVLVSWWAALLAGA